MVKLSTFNRRSTVAAYLSLVMLIAVGLISTHAQQRQPAQTSPPLSQDSNPLKLLQWRSIGPFRGGRVTAVAGVASQPMVYYFGATGGGVWKTTDGGANWEPISDGSVFGTGSVGAIGLCEADPNVIYVGMGESPVRGNVSHGDGVYKSMDAGKTWKRVGLEDTRQIGRVRVHPRNPDIVYVAALGHLFGPNEQRGVFRSKDGGKTWEKILYRSNKAGAIDLTFDPTNANILYAGFWEVSRSPWGFESGGAGGAPRVTTDVGLNRFIWNMRHDDAARFPGMIMWAGSTTGPRLAPGRYQVKLTADGKTYTETFDVRKDPRISTTDADFARQLDLQLKIRDKLTETHNAIISIREARTQINDLLKRVQGQTNFKTISDAAKSLNVKMTTIEEELYQTKNQSSQDPLNYPIRLNNKLAALGGVVSSADTAPTEQSYAVYEDLTAKINAQLQKLDAVLKSEIPAFNALVREQNIPAVIVKPPAATATPERRP